MGFRAKIKRAYLEKTGKIEEKWPIVIRVYRKAGEENYKLSQVTRGRTLREEDGNIELEILDSPLKSAEIPYEYFTNRDDGVDELEIVRHTRENFSPLMKNIEGTSAENDDSEMEEIDRIYKLEDMKKTLVDDWEKKTKITEDEDEHWIHDRRVQALIVFFGAGIFFVMLGIGYSKVVTKPLLEAANKIQAAQSIIPVVGVLGREKARELKRGKL